MDRKAKTPKKPKTAQGEGHEGRLTDARALLLDRATSLPTHPSRGGAMNHDWQFTSASGGESDGLAGGRRRGVRQVRWALECEEAPRGGSGGRDEGRGSTSPRIHRRTGDLAVNRAPQLRNGARPSRGRRSTALSSGRRRR